MHQFANRFKLYSIIFLSRSFYVFSAYIALFSIEKINGLSFLGNYSAFLSIIALSTTIIPFQLTSYLIHTSDRGILAEHKMIMFCQTILSFLTNLALSIVPLCIIFNHLEFASLGPSWILVSIIIFAASNIFFESLFVAIKNSTLASLVLASRSFWIYCFILVFVLTHRIGQYQLFRFMLINELSVLLCCFIFCYFYVRKFLTSSPHILPRVFQYEDWYRRSLSHGTLQTISGFFFIFSISIQRVYMTQLGRSESLGILFMTYSLLMFVPNLIESSYFSVKISYFVEKFSKPNCPQVSSINCRHFYVDYLKGMSSLFLISIVAPLPVFLIYKFISPYLGLPPIIQDMTTAFALFLFVILYAATRVVHYFIYSNRFFAFQMCANSIGLLISLLSFFYLAQFPTDIAYIISLLLPIVTIFSLYNLIAIFGAQYSSQFCRFLK